MDLSQEIALKANLLQDGLKIEFKEFIEDTGVGVEKYKYAYNLNLLRWIYLISLRK